MKERVAAEYECDQCGNKELSSRFVGPSGWFKIYCSGGASDFCTAECTISWLQAHRDRLHEESELCRCMDAMIKGLELCRGRSSQGKDCKPKHGELK